MDSRRALILCLAGLLCAVSLYFSHEYFLEDSFITLRYADRLVQGKGLTWNDGERVEGFSNFFWLVQNALLKKLGMDLEVSSRLLGLLYYFALLTLFLMLKVPGILFIPLATLPSLTMYALSGMETVSFCFWLLAGTVLLDRESGKLGADATGLELPNSRKEFGAFFLAGLLFAAAGLTRPEGVLSGLFALGFLLAKGLKRNALIYSLGFFPAIAGYQLFRMVYFGSLLPNTYYAKSAHVSKSILVKSAVYYLAKWGTEWVPITVLIVLVLVKSDWKRGVFPIIVSLPPSIALVLGGGDHMKGIRLVLPALILAGYGAARAMESFFRRTGFKTVSISATVVITMQMAASTVHWKLPLFPLEFGLKPRSFAAAHGEIVGRFLEQNLPAGALVAVNSAGAPPYFAPSLRFVDMLGLNDKVIARRKVSKIITRYQRKPGHFKGDGSYVLSRNPDVVMIGLTYGFYEISDGNQFLSDYELMNTCAFHEKYTPYQIVVPIRDNQREWYEVKTYLKEGKYLITVWLRNDSTAVARMRSLGTRLPPLP